MTSNYRDLARFVTKKWIEIYDQSRGENDNVNKEVRIEAPMLRLDLCDFSDACIVLKGIVTVTEPSDAKRNKRDAVRNNAPFINWISKISGVQTDDAENLDVAMPM